MQPTSPWLDLYNSPDPVTIFNLNTDDFKDFVKYVFERAGYYVEPFDGPGAHLILKFEGKTEGYVACSSGVRRVGSNPVLALNGIPVGGKLPKYFVSSESFSTEAIHEEEKVKNLHLIDKTRLSRLINYVRGTRHPSSKNLPFDPAYLFDEEPLKRDRRSTKVLVLANNKGGVCKTTSAFAIGAILATEKKKRVLFVDLDDQANLTQVVSRSTAHANPNISHYFADNNAYPLYSLIRPTHLGNVWLIPSHPDLRLTLPNVVDWTGTEQQFVRSLHHPLVATTQNEQFDWIILDTPPSLGLYTRAALLAAHYVLAPFTPSTLDRVGLSNLLETLDDVSCIANAADQTQILGCFTTRWRRSASATSDIAAMKDIALAHGAGLFETDIGEDAANVRKLILPEGNPNLARIHGALDDYRELVKEIQKHVGDN